MAPYNTPQAIRPLEKTVCDFAYSNGYDPISVFNDFLRYVIHGFSPGAPPLMDWKYKRQQNRYFMEMLTGWIRLMQREFTDGKVIRCGVDRVHCLEYSGGYCREYQELGYRYRALSAGVGVCFYFLFYVRVCVEALLFSPTAEVCSEFFRYSGFAGYLTSIYRLAFRHGTLSAGDPHFPVDSCVPYL